MGRFVSATEQLLATYGQFRSAKLGERISPQAGLRSGRPAAL